MGVAVDQHVPQHRRETRRDAPSDPLRRRGQGEFPLSGGALFLVDLKKLQQPAAGLQPVPDGDRLSARLRERPAHHVAQETERFGLGGDGAMFPGVRFVPHTGEANCARILSSVCLSRPLVRSAALRIACACSGERVLRCGR